MNNMTLTDNPRYVELRPIIRHDLVLVFTDIRTAYHFFVAEPSPLAYSIHTLNLSLQIDELEERTRRLTFAALAELQGLAEVNLWIDTAHEFPLRHMRQRSSIFRLPPVLQPIVTLDCPASEESELQWIQAYFRGSLPRSRLRRRGYPKFYVDSHGVLSSRDEEPIESFSDSDDGIIHAGCYRVIFPPFMS